MNRLLACSCGPLQSYDEINVKELQQFVESFTNSDNIELAGYYFHLGIIDPKFKTKWMQMALNAGNFMAGVQLFNDNASYLTLLKMSEIINKNKHIYETHFDGYDLFEIRLKFFCQIHQQGIDYNLHKINIEKPLFYEYVIKSIKEDDKSAGNWFLLYKYIFYQGKYSLPYSHTEFTNLILHKQLILIEKQIGQLYNVITCIPGGPDALIASNDFKELANNHIL